MHYNYHKRLTNYLSSPQSIPRRAQSQTSFINAANAKYYQSPRINNNRPNDKFYNSHQSNSQLLCPQCMGPPNLNHGVYSYQGSSNFNCNNQFHSKQKPNQNGLAASQYFGPEIKTIRNTLIDIRDQMKNKPKRKPYNQQNNRKFTQQSDTQIYERMAKQENQRIRSNYAQKESHNKQLLQRIEQLEQINQRLKRQNNQLQEDIRDRQTKMRDYQIQIEQQRGRANRIQNEKNHIQQRERSLQLQIMDLRAQLMRNQQVLRQLNFNEQQMRQKQVTKRLTMGPSDEFSMTVNWKDGYKQSRSSQTHLTQVDIENGYKQLNAMQDNLCDKINANLKVEKKIFARVAQIDDKLSFAYDRLYQVQENALRLGISI